MRNQYGLPCVVSVNHFTADTDAEHALLAKKMAALDVPLVLARHWAEGGAGATDVARKVVEIVEKGASNFRFVYDEKQTLWDKVKTIATKIYGAADISADSKIRARIEELQKTATGTTRVHRQDAVLVLDRPRPARSAERTHGQHPRGAAGRRRGVHRRGMRRRHDHAGTAEGAVRRQDRHRRTGTRRGTVLESQHDLADMLRGLDHPMRLAGIGEREGGMDDRADAPVGEQRPDVPPHALGDQRLLRNAPYAQRRARDG